MPGYVYELTGADNYYDIPTDDMLAGYDVTARIRTYGGYVDPSDYTGLLFTTLAEAPQVAFTSPGATVATLPIEVAWTFVDEFAQAGWSLSLYDDADVLLGTWTGTTETTQTLSGIVVENAAEHRLVLTARSGSGFQTTIELTVETDYTGPDTPTVTATWDAVALSATIVGEVGAGTPAADHLALIRLETFDGVTETTTLADPYTSGETYIDRLPRLGQTVTYRVLAVGADGGYSYADDTVSTDSAGNNAVQFGDDLDDQLLLCGKASVSRSASNDSEAFQFAGRTSPVLYSGESTTERLNVSALLTDATQIAAVRRLKLWRKSAIYREVGGYRATVYVEQVSDSRSRGPEHVPVSLNLLVVE